LWLPRVCIRAFQRHIGRHQGNDLDNLEVSHAIGPRAFWLAKNRDKRGISLLCYGIPGNEVSYKPMAGIKESLNTTKWGVRLAPPGSRRGTQETPPWP